MYLLLAFCLAFQSAPSGWTYYTGTSALGEATASASVRSTNTSLAFTQPRAELKHKGEKETFEQGKDGVSYVMILYKEKAKYTAAARKNRIVGTVRLRVAFNADESITVIEITQGLPDGLNDKAIEAARRVRFQPAMKDEKPVTTEGYLEFTFKPY